MKTPHDLDDWSTCEYQWKMPQEGNILSLWPLEIENLRFLQKYDDYKCTLGIKSKGLPLASFERSSSEIKTY